MKRRAHPRVRLFYLIYQNYSSPTRLDLLCCYRNVRKSSQTIEKLAKNARSASLSLASATTEQKNEALQHIAEGLESNRKLLTEENQKDLDNAPKKWIE